MTEYAPAHALGDAPQTEFAMAEERNTMFAANPRRPIAKYKQDVLNQQQVRERFNDWETALRPTYALVNKLADEAELRTMNWAKFK